MNRIHRYRLRHIDRQTVPLPKGAEILSVQSRNGTNDQFDLWALVDPDAPLFGRVVLIVGTGHDVPAGPVRFISTIQVAAGDFVFHVFEEVET